MAFNLDVVKKQVIAALNLAARDSLNIPQYTETVAGGDTAYADEEVGRACQSAVTDIMRTICETDGHSHRPLFENSTALTHGSVLPPHIGSPGVPRITPYSGATFTITGKRKSIEEISAYRANPNNFYSLIAHDANNGGMPSKLSGYYAIDQATKVIYFTGSSAVADLANFQESDYELLPDLYYPDAINLAIKHLMKDGAASDIFTYHAQLAENGLAAIRMKESDQPSPKKTVGTRDSGTK